MPAAKIYKYYPMARVRVSLPGTVKVSEKVELYLESFLKAIC
jgi:hypothetical protein